MRKPLLVAIGAPVVAYVLLSLVSGDWVKTLLVFPAAAFVFFLNFYVTTRKPRR